MHTVQVLDLQTGEWSTLPGTPVRVAGDEDALAMAWSGDVLGIVAANGDAVLWRPGDPVAYAVPDQPVRAGDEIAIFPPVTGG